MLYGPAVGEGDPAAQSETAAERQAFDDVWDGHGSYEAGDVWALGVALYSLTSFCFDGLAREYFVFLSSEPHSDRLSGAAFCFALPYMGAAPVLKAGRQIQMLSKKSPNKRRPGPGQRALKRYRSDSSASDASGAVDGEGEELGLAVEEDGGTDDEQARQDSEEAGLGDDVGVNLARQDDVIFPEADDDILGDEDDSSRTRNNYVTGMQKSVKKLFLEHGVRFKVASLDNSAAGEGVCVNQVDWVTLFRKYCSRLKTLLMDASQQIGSASEGPRAISAAPGASLKVGDARSTLVNLLNSLLIIHPDRRIAQWEQTVESLEET
eukprot:g15771.t1